MIVRLVSVRLDFAFVRLELVDSKPPARGSVRQRLAFARARLETRILVGIRTILRTVLDDPSGRGRRRVARTGATARPVGRGGIRRPRVRRTPDAVEDIRRARAQPTVTGTPRARSRPGGGVHRGLEPRLAARAVVVVPAHRVPAPGPALRSRQLCGRRPRVGVDSAGDAAGAAAGARRCRGPGVPRGESKS